MENFRSEHIEPAKKYIEKYDELDNIISSISVLVDEITNKEYIEQLNEIKYQAENDMEEIEEELQKVRDKEEK